MVSRRVEFSKDAKRDLEDMPAAEAEGVFQALVQFAETGKGDVRKLNGKRDRWALRWGNWRAIYTPSGQILRILRVMDRKDVYRY